MRRNSTIHTGHFIIRLSIQFIGLDALVVFARDGLWFGFGYGFSFDISIDRLDNDETGAVNVDNWLCIACIDSRRIRLDGDQVAHLIGLLVFGVVDRNCLDFSKFNG